MVQTKQPKKRLPKLRHQDLIEIQPESDNQAKAFDAFDDGKNLMLSGVAGTGKTFIALFLALELVLDANSNQDEVIIMRSVVPTRDIGFLPGSQDEKTDIYKLPYKAICHQLFGRKDAYEQLDKQHTIRFETTSFIRGLTFDNAVIIVDEMQNLSGHELDSVITRIGQSCRIIFAGDYRQSDFVRTHEKRGVLDFLTIIKNMSCFETVEFDWEDIVRSDMVREYLMTKDMMRRDNLVDIDW